MDRETFSSVLSARMRLIAKKYWTGDIDIWEDAIEEMRDFTHDHFQSFPRQAQDTSNWDWGVLLDQYVSDIEEEARWTS